jgi:hypothetical protein
MDSVIRNAIKIGYKFEGRINIDLEFAHENRLKRYKKDKFLWEYFG